MQKLNEMSMKLSFDAEGKVLNEFKISLLPPFTFYEKLQLNQRLINQMEYFTEISFLIYFADR
jgi:hypothetical protein